VGSVSDDASRTGLVIADRYQIVRQLGAGGMGAVYQAKQLSMDRMVALKLIHPHIASRPEVAARFHREMQAMSRIEHPSTIQVFDYGATADGQLFLAMEYLEGCSLASIAGPMPLSRLLHIARQIVRALGAAHAEGIAHRDLKPDNVMLLDRYGDKDVVKVLDFGIARFVDDAGANPQMTAEGALLGTPAYMSPEQALGRAVDYRADWYSLGVMLYQLATGRLPFEAQTIAGLLVAHASETPLLPSTHAAIPPALDALILRLLAKSPEDRPQDAAALLASLDACELAPTLPSLEVPAKRAPIGLGLAIAAALAGAGIAGAVAITRTRTAAEHARVRLEAAFAAEGDPLAPAACRTHDRRMTERLARATELMAGASYGAPRAQDREALALLSDAGELPPEGLALQARARLIVDAEPPDTARDTARDALARCPSFALADDLVGVAEQRARRLDDAEAAYQRALSDAPGYIAPRLNLGLLALARGQTDAAVAAFDAVLRTQPEHVRAYLARGQARMLLKDYAGAVLDLENATKREPSSKQAWLELGQARKLAGDAAGASAAFRKAIELGANETEAR
jgi:serine/threonine-protein kinase